ncbi:helix-turn-helix transcriptional regulator [Paenibacillus sp. RC67]|uniref:PadR family transcriptional regulator n=1 Tax=Paenibacillus sp. RC67 TaxID=3039392 RepID=UPI0024AC914A|nr:helix-turn-helix transcriptional regulator [Paenibacillus sp. RC67]
MNINKLLEQYIPMSETAFYTLLSLLEVRHGYGIMQHVDEITGGRIRLGAGTLYGSLSRMEKDGLIGIIAEEDRRKLYQVTSAGKTLLKAEMGRIGELYHNAKKVEGKLDE